MTFENPFKKSPVREIALAAGALATLRGAVEVGHAVDKAAEALYQAPPTAPATATMPAEHHNPTLGKTTDSAPDAIDLPYLAEKVTIDSPHIAEKVAIDVETKHISIDTPTR